MGLEKRATKVESVETMDVQRWPFLCARQRMYKVEGQSEVYVFVLRGEYRLENIDLILNVLLERQGTTNSSTLRFGQKAFYFPIRSTDNDSFVLSSPSPSSSPFSVACIGYVEIEFLERLIGGNLETMMEEKWR